MAGVQYTLHDDRSHLSKDIKKKQQCTVISYEETAHIASGTAAATPFL